MIVGYLIINNIKIICVVLCNWKTFFFFKFDNSLEVQVFKSYKGKSQN